MAEHYASRHYIYDEIDQNLQEDSESFDSSVTVWKNFSSPHSSAYSSDKERATHAIPRYLESNPLGSSLVYCLESKVKGKLVPLWLVGSFFQFVPARMGRNAALDDAVSCLCDIYRSSYNCHSGVYQSYVKALSSLRGCLSDTSIRMESETLCASILLQICEVNFVSRNSHQLEMRLIVNDLVKLVVNVDKGHWSDLGHGTTTLLYSRGAHSYTSAFDHAMLESQLSVIVCDTRYMSF